jgi:hypothetical protein
MKKFIFALAVTLVMGVAFTSCSKCSHNEEPQPAPTTEDTNITKVIKADKVHMDSIDNTYMYFETTYTFSGNVDTLTTPDVVEMTNVFETVDKVKLEPTVYFAEHSLGAKDSTVWDVRQGSFWLEDFDLREYEYKLTVEDAFRIMNMANIVKPKSKYCVLRAQLGPKKTNPQYIFGNDNTGIVFVDALNGGVSTVNPVFGTAKRITSKDK